MQGRGAWDALGAWGTALGTLQLRSGVADACLVIITQVVAPIWDCEATKRVAQVCRSPGCHVSMGH